MSPGERMNRALRATGLSERQMHMLLYIAVRDGNGQGCWASQETMSKETGIPQRSVERTIGELKALGLISVQRRKQQSAVIKIAPGEAKNRHPDGGSKEPQKPPSSAGSRDASRTAKLPVPRTATQMADKPTEPTSPSPSADGGARRPLSRVGSAPPPSSSSLAPEGGVQRDDDAAPPTQTQASGGLRRLSGGAGVQLAEVAGEDIAPKLPPSPLPPTIAEVEAAATDDAKLIGFLREDIDDDAIVAIAVVLMKQWQILGSQFAPWLRKEVGMSMYAADKFVTYGGLLRDGQIERDMIPPPVERAFTEHLEASHAA